MKKYNYDDVNRYINGDDIDKFDIEDLENDPSFMIDVIKISNDYHFYDLCSDAVKTNIDFVEFYVEKFKDNIGLICKVADYYLNLCLDEDDGNVIELLIIMCDLTKKDEAVNIKYEILLETLCLANRKEYYENEYGEQFYDFGFWEIYDTYNHCPLVVDYFAKKILADIFNINGYKLFNKLFTTFSSLEDLKEYGLNKFLLEFIGTYDDTLESYVSGHIHLLSDKVNEINSFKEMWLYRKNQADIKRYEIICEFVRKYVDSFDNECSFIDLNILYNIGLELGMDANLLKYVLNLRDDEIQFIGESVKQKRFVNITEIKHYNNIKKIVSEILKIDDISKIGDFEDFVEDLGISIRKR